MSTCLRPAALLMVALIATTAAAQTHSRHRIEITRRPRTGARPASPVPRAPAASPGVIDWMGQQKAAPTLEARGAMTILADDLTLAGGAFALGGTSRLWLAARTLRITGRVTIDVSSRTAGEPGGMFTLLAEAVRCAPGGVLTITSNGGSSSSPGVAGTDGGTLTVAVDSIGPDGEAAAPRAAAQGPRAAARPLPPAQSPMWTAQGRGDPSTNRQSVECISFSSTGGRGIGKAVQFIDRAGRRRTRFEPPTPGRPGTIVRVANRAAAASQQDDARLALSRWTVAALQRLRGRILDADAAEDYATLVQLFVRYAAFAPPADLHPRMREEYDELRAELNKYRGEVLLPVFARPIEVTPPAGVAQRLHVFTESSPFRQTLAPTHLLASGIDFEGRKVLGLLEYDPNRPDEITIEVELELTVDPWLAALAAAHLRAEGEAVEGMFSGWTLKARPIEEIGVKESRVTALPGGRRMRVRLVLEGQKAGTMFWNLFSGTGIPLTYDWEFRGGSNQPVTNGTWSGPTLSFARRAAHTLRVEGGRVRNDGPAPVLIEYVALGETKFVGLARAVRIEAGHAVDLKELGVAVDGSTVWIPPQAVITTLDPREIERAFYVVNGQQFIQHVTLTNLLPAYDSPSGGALHYVEVFVAIGAGAQADATKRAGPFRLSAAQTTGSEIRLPFLRPGKGSERITVWGAAHYDNGGCQTIVATTFESGVATVTPSMLARNQPQPGTTGPGPCSK